MNKAAITAMVSIALLVISKAATAAVCWVYATSSPARFSGAEGSIDTPPLAHTVVLRNAGFKQNPIEFFIFPSALANERFAIDTDINTASSGSKSSSSPNRPDMSAAATPEGFSKQLSSSGTTNSPTTLDSPSTSISFGTAGDQSQSPLPGQILVMSNSAFIGELNSRLDPATTRQVAAAAIDFGQFGTIGDNIMGFQLIPMRETWNMVVAPTQQNATEDVQILQAAQGLIRFTEDSGAILGDMNLLIVDDIDNPTLRVRYEGTFEGTLVKQVSC